MTSPVVMDTIYTAAEGEPSSFVVFNAIIASHRNGHYVLVAYRIDVIIPLPFWPPNPAGLLGRSSPNLPHSVFGGDPCRFIQESLANAKVSAR